MAKEEIQLKINADIKSAKKNLQEVKKESNELKDSVGAFGVTWGSVKKTFSKFKTITVNGLKAIKIQAQLAGLSFKQMFSGQILAGARNLFKIIKVGIASTGIGLLVVAFGSLVQYFRDSEAGASKFKQITAQLGVVVGNVTDIISDLGKSVFKLMKGDFKGFKDGLSDVTQGVKDFGETTRKEMGMANQLEKDRLALQQFERKAMVDKAEAEKEMMRLRLAARDEENFSASERVEFMKEATKLAEIQLEKDLHVAQEKLRFRKEENSYNKSTKDNLDEEARLEADVFRIQRANFSERKRMAMEEIALTNQMNAEIKAEKDRKDAEDKLKLDADKKAADVLRDLQNQNMLLAISDATEKAHAELDIQKEKELKLLESHENFLQLKAEVDKKYETLHGNIKKKEVEVIEVTEQMKLATVSKGLAATRSLAGDHKGLAIAQATIDTYSAVTGALADKTTPSATLRFINAASMGLMGLANVKKILSTDVGSGSNGGSVPNVESQSPAPQFASGSFELSGGATQEPIQAFVVTDDMSSSQDKLASIRRRATI